MNDVCTTVNVHLNRIDEPLAIREHIQEFACLDLNDRTTLYIEPEAIDGLHEAVAKAKDILKPPPEPQNRPESNAAGPLAHWEGWQPVNASAATETPHGDYARPQKRI